MPESIPRTGRMRFLIFIFSWIPSDIDECPYSCFLLSRERKFSWIIPLWVLLRPSKSVKPVKIRWDQPESQSSCVSLYSSPKSSDWGQRSLTSSLSSLTKIDFPATSMMLFLQSLMSERRQANLSCSSGFPIIKTPDATSDETPVVRGLPLVIFCEFVTADVLLLLSLWGQLDTVLSRWNKWDKGRCPCTYFIRSFLVSSFIPSFSKAFTAILFSHINSSPHYTFQQSVVPSTFRM